MNLSQVRSLIDNAFRSYTSAKNSLQYNSLLPTSSTAGKLYEAYVLGKVAEKLVKKEGFQLRLINSNYIALKSSPGPINRTYPRIELRKQGKITAELWTDVEFLSMSYKMNTKSTKPTNGEYHELDILIVEPGLNGRPSHDEIWLGVECKNTGYKKSLLKEILGIRRELSLLQPPMATNFLTWPRSTVPADPASCLLVFSSDKAVKNYSAPGKTYGINFYYEKLP